MKKKEIFYTATGLPSTMIDQLSRSKAYHWETYYKGMFYYLSCEENCTSKELNDFLKPILERLEKKYEAEGWDISKNLPAW